MTAQPGFASVLTPEGVETIDDIEPGVVIQGLNDWLMVVNKQAIDLKPVFRYITKTGLFLGTSDSYVVERGYPIKVSKAEEILTHCGSNRIVRHGYVGRFTVYNIQATGHVYWSGGCYISNVGV